MDRALDNSFGVQFVALFVLTVIIGAIGTALAYFLVPEAAVEGASDVGTASWWAWIRVVDPGQLAESHSSPRLTIAIAAMVVLAGWIVFGLLISILTTAFQERLESIKSGTAEILCSDHTIVLGWNSTVFSVIDQLGSDDEQLSGEVVVLCDLDVSRMREEASKYCKPRSLKKVYFRRGSIASINTIAGLKIADARQVIILGFDDDPSDDAEQEAATGTDPISSSVLKALLACYQALSNDGRKKGEYRMPIVASVNSAGAAHAIQHGVPKTLTGVCDVHVVHTTDLLSRLTAQVANEPSLSRVFTEIFSYEGTIVDGQDISSEVYVEDVDQRMHGRTFDDCIMGYERAIPIGYVSGGKTIINPLPNTPESTHKFGPGDRIVAIADTVEDVAYEGRLSLPLSDFHPPEIKLPPKHVLVLGNGKKPLSILKHLPGYLPGNSRVATNLPLDGLPEGTVTYEKYVHGASSDEEAGTADVTAADLTSFDCIVLADDLTDPDLHDAKVLMDLTTIYAAAEGSDVPATAIVELLDYRNVALARAFGQMAALVSSELVSNFLVQLAVEPARGAVFQELLDPSGCELHVRGPQTYVKSTDEKLSFNDLFARVRACGDILVGYIPPDEAFLQLSPRDRTTTRAVSGFGELVVVCEQ